MFSAFANCWRIPELRARLVATVALVFVARIGANIPLPGIDPKELDVTVTGNQLVLSGEKKESSEHDEKDFYRSETRYGSFRRTVPLPEGVDTENVDAQYANGVLTLRLKKIAPAAAKRIEVKTK